MSVKTSFNAAAGGEHEAGGDALKKKNYNWSVVMKFPSEKLRH